MLWYEIALKVLYYIALPIASILVLLYHIIQGLLAPFISIARGILKICLTPYNVAVKFEAVWYYLGSAVVIGLISALVLHLILRSFIFVFNLDRPSIPKPKDRPARGHDMKSYRAAREKKKLEAEREQAELDERARQLAASPLLKTALQPIWRESLEESPSTIQKKTGRQSLLDQTIIENSSEDS